MDTTTVKVATPWGKARVLEEAWAPQEAEGKEFAAVLQLVELEGGERLVRLAYTTDGTARRGPVTLRLGDLTRLRDAAGGLVGLRELLGEGAAAGARARRTAVGNARRARAAPDAR
ncbi:MAG: hypothetical protein R3C15_21245 [Thermoleophilia bacterium]